MVSLTGEIIFPMGSVSREPVRRGGLPLLGRSVASLSTGAVTLNCFVHGLLADVIFKKKKIGPSSVDFTKVTRNLGQVLIISLMRLGIVVILKVK